MADVFISYSTQRRELAETLALDLSVVGLTVWWDTSLLPVGSFREEIDYQLGLADAVVVIWTPEAIRSMWVLAEADHALRNHKLINTRVPEIEPWRIPMPFNQINSAELTNRAAIIAAVDKLTRRRPLRPEALQTVPTRIASEKAILNSLALDSWQKIRSTNDVAELRGFLKEFGDTAIAELAQDALAAMSRAAWRRTKRTDRAEIVSFIQTYGDQEDASEARDILTALANQPRTARDYRDLLLQGVAVWNDWRRDNSIYPVLEGVDLSGQNLGGANLSHADLRGANLSKANLVGAILDDADLSACNLDLADLHQASLIRALLRNARMNLANLARADLDGTDLSGAKLNGASLGRAVLRNVVFSNADLTDTFLEETVFANVNLASTIGLDNCRHISPSTVDYRTQLRSGSLPLTFLRGVGLPDIQIDYMPALLNQPIQHYSCFISYSTKDQNFADRLHSDLQNKGVRCWFAPHDMPIGGKILDEIDAAIRLRDKVLLILSAQSIVSDWVEDELSKAFEEERKREQTVLLPLRLDDAIMELNEAWAAKLRARHIGDFRRWKEHDEYQKSFERVLRDLTVKKP